MAELNYCGLRCFWLTVMIKHFRRHSKGLSALTALIGSLMKLPTIPLTVKADAPVCTLRMHVSLEFHRNGLMFNKSLRVDHKKCVMYLLHNTVKS